MHSTDSMRTAAILLLGAILLAPWGDLVQAQTGGVIELEPIRQLIASAQELPAEYLTEQEGEAPASAAELPPAAKAADSPEAAPPLDLPRRFFWQGRTLELGHVGYVYLGDYYFVEERDYLRAETAYRHALQRWPQCAPIQTRLDLLQVCLGNWQQTAAGLQVGLTEDLPPVVRQEYGLNADSPLESSHMAKVPPVPAMLFRLALEALNQLPEDLEDSAAREFLRGRLLAFLGEYEASLTAFQRAAGDRAASPWNFQAASQCAAIQVRSWRPDRAYASLLKARSWVGENPVLESRILALEEDLRGLGKAAGGDWHAEEVRVLGREDSGRWILASPRSPFSGPVSLMSELPQQAALAPHFIYRGDDYWLLAFPLGAPEPEWSPGESVTIEGYLASLQ